MKGRVARVVPVGIVLQFITASWCFLHASGPKQQSVPSSQDVAHYRAVVTQYCTTCHNERTKTGGLALDKVDFNNVGANAEIWEKAVRKLRVGMMPPHGPNKPVEQTPQTLVSSLKTELDRAAGGSPNPGRPLLHRLNRVEYG